MKVLHEDCVLAYILGGIKLPVTGCKPLLPNSFFTTKDVPDMF
jgi:hypothetical protein